MKKMTFLEYLLFLLGDRKKYKKQDHGNAQYNELLRSKLLEYMEKKKPYLLKHYRMKDLANDLDVPVYQLSAFVNGTMGMHFTDLINKFRIRHCERLLRANPNRKHNFKELADECGFSNRNSFAAAFEKFTGKKPTEYLKGL